MLSALSWELVGALLAAASIVPCTAASAVNVALEASFNSPPYLLELLETAALENSTSYFPLLDRIATGHFSDYTTERDLYDAFLRLLKEDGHIAQPDALSSFQLALSIHAAAPRIEAHYQYYNTAIEPLLTAAQDGACPVWIHFMGKQYCSPTLERPQQDFKGPTKGTGKHGQARLPFDRVLGADSDAPMSTLYVDINSPLFSHFHQTLSATAKEGKTNYRLRYRPAVDREDKPLAVSGYGVELALKKTDYIVIDDRDKESSDTDIEVSKEKVSLDTEDVNDLKPLSSSDLLGLGLKASSFILGSEDPFNMLLKVSQDFPKHSSAIAKVNTSLDFVTEHAANREQFLPAGYNVIWMNGLQVEARQMDAYTLLEKLRSERNLISRIRDAGLTAPEAINLISHSAHAEVKAKVQVQRYDYRDDIEGGNVIVWMNDITKDKRYEDWPAENVQLMQRMYPGQLPQVRKDMFNMVLPVDLSDKKDIEIIVETLQAFVKRKIPLRIGLVPLVSTQESAGQAVAFYYVARAYGISSAMAYLGLFVRDRQPRFDAKRLLQAVKGRDPRKSSTPLSEDEILGKDGLEKLQAVVSFDPTARWLARLGVSAKVPMGFVDGVALPRNEGWLQVMSERIATDLQIIQQAVYLGQVDDNTWLAGQFLEGAVVNRNALIIPEDESAVKILDIASIISKHAAAYNASVKLAASKEALKQFWAHIVVVHDMGTDDGARFVAEAVNFQQENPDVELIILPNPLNNQSRAIPLDNLKQIIGSENPLDKELLRTVLQPEAMDGVEANEREVEYRSQVELFVAALGLPPGTRGIVLNGRLVGPIPNNIEFTSGDFRQLLEYERSKRISPANTALAAMGLEDRLESPLAAAKVISLIALSSSSDVPEGIFESSSSLRMSMFDKWNSEQTSITRGDIENSSIHIVASIDPTSEVAQRWLPILKVLSELHGVYLKLFLNPREKIAELPVKRFYRHVLDAKPSFDQDGNLINLKATFEGLPKEALLTVGLDVPPAWLVSPKISDHDPDNIKLSAIKDRSDINAIYQLEHILIEGHSHDLTTGQPPRGVQLQMGTESKPHVADTLVMANLGYFQFKANPGYWTIELQSGKSAQIFDIETLGGEENSEKPGAGSTEVTLMSFQGKTLFPKLSKKPGKELEDVLEETSTGSALNYASKAGKLAQAWLSKVGVQTKFKHADINIFSVASGHLYERMLNIMMVSVMKHTKHTVKFWFIEQFLSPSFKQSIPDLAAVYNFEYEMVTYKWPHWLRAQKEKQREIWGYKILFLDVLFPLSLDKVIFVDADQIVRTDMYELVTHDLEGKPYGFTPMCDSRTEMEGFRFWKQGYWKNYLRGLPYHISALYVVDLKKFRQIAAGDRLRQQYHTLSADPASLSNLDQDLPNHMQMSLPIHSLPQEWLWCETWCSDESLKEARTIDLCNNPMTKEPKLDRARRQVPEWTVYDDEITEVLKKARESRQDVYSESAGQLEEEVLRGSVQEGLDGAQEKIKDEL